MGAGDGSYTFSGVGDYCNMDRGNKKNLFIACGNGKALMLRRKRGESEVGVRCFHSLQFLLQEYFFFSEIVGGKIQAWVHIRPPQSN